MEQLYAGVPDSPTPVQREIDYISVALSIFAPSELAEFAKHFVEADPGQASRLIDALIKALEMDK